MNNNEKDTWITLQIEIYSPISAIQDINKNGIMVYQNTHQLWLIFIQRICGTYKVNSFLSVNFFYTQELEIESLLNNYDRLIIVYINSIPIHIKIRYAPENKPIS
jgi:hypothetical protein